MSDGVAGRSFSLTFNKGVYFYADKPDCFPNLTHRGWIFVDLFSRWDTEPYAHIALLFSTDGHNNKAVTMHLEANKYTPSLKRLGTVQWEIVKEFMRNKGAVKIYAPCADPNDEKWIKFNEMFGFKVQTIIMGSYNLENEEE